MAFGHKVMKKFRRSFFSLARSLHNNNGLRNIRKNVELHNTLTKYLESSKSIGCSYSDYWILYSYIKKHKPREILECGTGVSTIVMAHALMENEKEGHLRARITSMEDQEVWYEHAHKIMPDHLRPYVELVLGERTEYCYTIFRGVGYRELPDRPYEFVFVDGPQTQAPSDGKVTFDFDYINVVMKSDNPVFGIVDKRYATSYVLQKIFGSDKVRFSPRYELCFVGPFTKQDLRGNPASFRHSFRILRRTELALRMRYCHREEHRQSTLDKSVEPQGATGGWQKT